MVIHTTHGVQFASQPFDGFAQLVNKIISSRNTTREVVVRRHVCQPHVGGTHHCSVHYLGRYTYRKYTMFCVQPKACLGMLDAFPFRINNVCYDSILQWVLCQRAVLADDHQAFKDIRNTNCHTEMKKRAALISMETELAWEETAYQACLEGVRAKYKGACQHELLYGENFAYIDEDTFWGTAGSATGAKIGIPFRGKNVYGQILDRVRSELFDEAKLNELAQT